MGWIRVRKMLAPILIAVIIFSVFAVPGCGEVFGLDENAVAAAAEATVRPVAIGTGSNNGTSGTGTNTSAGDETAKSDKDELRGVWVSTILNLDYPSAAGISVDALKAEAIDILDNCVEMGFNAIFLQVRPSGDAFYKSSLFPWSEYLTGKQGKAPAGDFDPLKYWVEQAHARGLQLHAWINPYRVARQSHDLTALAASNYARKNPGWVVKHTDGNMYYDPGIPAVRSLVIDGVIEIVNNYDVDGIHFDDYFYPDAKFADDATYKKYGSGYSSKDNWRRSNTDKLIEETYKAVKKADPTVVFGVSPFGIWANKSTSTLGSNTTGNQSYINNFADSRKWVLNEWLDYICPQLYWNIGFKVADYQVLLNWWSDVVRDTDVDLYIGHSSYRSGNSDPSSPWYGTSELRRQLNLNAVTPEVKGSVHFRYKFFIDYAPLGRFITIYHSDFEVPEDYPVMPDAPTANGISLGRPLTDITTTNSKMYVIGHCAPSVPLLLNGTEVTGVTEDGYFGVMVPLNVGKNVLTFKQGSSTLVRTISRSAASTAATYLKKSTAEIIKDSTYPHIYNVYITPGEKITFRCTAPIGASVKVTLAGKSYNLIPSATKSPGTDAIYYTGYSYTYTMPKTSVTGKVLNIGTPVYTMTYKGKTSSRTATGDLLCITPGAPYYAKVKTDNTFLYASSSTSGGSIGELKAGMTDYITAVTTSGTWVRLGMGGWVKREDVDRINGEAAFSAGLSKPVYSVGEKWDRLSFSVKSLPAAKVSLSGGTLTLTISSSGGLPALKLPQGSLVTAYSSSYDGRNAIYQLTIDPKAKLDGYYLDTGEGTLSLHLKRRPKASVSVTAPLEGMVIMVDAGHGNTDTGALGPLGTDLPEKDITLYTARKVRYELEALGATVLMTRKEDEAVTLDDRLKVFRSQKPDLFVSIHNNAVDVTVDSSNIKGISTWYMRGVSYDFASQLVDYLAADLGRTNRRANSANLYVCRGTWAPSVIVETGFICTPSEFEWMSDDESQTELARSIARGIVQYFS